MINVIVEDNMETDKVNKMLNRNKVNQIIHSSNSVDITTCQIRPKNDFIHSEVNCMDSYKISINVEVEEDDDGKEVYNLIDDIKNLLKERKGNNLYQSIKNIEITRSQNMMVVKQWKEGIESGMKEGMVYQIPLQSQENGHTEPFVVKEVGNTREEEIGKSSWGN